MSSTTAVTSTTSSSSSSTASSTTTSFQLPSSLKVIGIILAITSGLLIGSSFVFKKKGLLRSQAGQVAGEGVAYLKSPLWWTGMIMMILGEMCNFTAYAFVEALVVTPMGALSVVICAILSSIFLKEKLTFFGWLGCALCIIGSVIIALNGPQEQTPGEISAFQKLFFAPGFLAYISVLIAIALVIIIYFGPRYGKQSMLWYITVCSTIGGISVSVTTGLGAAIVTTAMGHNQFNNWFIFFLIGFVVVTLLTEVYYLNVALALFNTAMVTPTYYVLFSFCSMLTTIVLFKGLAAPVSQILTLVLAFLTICVGITILQMSKVDPAQFSSLDRRSTMLLQAARAHTDGPGGEGEEGEKSLTALEDPGMDALRGSFGTVGSMIRARTVRRLSQSSRGGSSVRTAGRGLGVGGGMVGSLESVPFSALHHTDRAYDGLARHQLYDAPVPSTPSMQNLRGDDADRTSSFSSSKSPRQTAIKFDSQDVVHSYAPTGSREVAGAKHSAVRSAAAQTGSGSDSKAGSQSYGYPPTSPTPGHERHQPFLDESNTASSSPHSLSSSPYANPHLQYRTQSSQSIALPQRTNDEPPAPTIPNLPLRYFTADSHPENGTDPFQTPDLSAAPFGPADDSVSPSPIERGGSPPFFGSHSRSVGGSGASSTSGSESASPQATAHPSRAEIRPLRVRRSNSTTQSRRYPVRGVDDIEERVGLWERRPAGDEEAGVEQPGIRLVQPAPRMGEPF